MTGPDLQALLAIVLDLCDDLATTFDSLSRGLDRDKKYISRRVEAEGINFLTKSLPKFGKDFDKWLKDETVTPAYAVDNFAPSFLSGVKDLIVGNRMTVNDRATVYRWVRQLAYLLYKVEVPFTEPQLLDAYRGFVERNNALEDSDAKISLFETGEAARLLGASLEGFNPLPLVPKHGPGSVATGEIGDDKWAFKRLYRSVHRRFPWYDYFVPTPRVWSHDPHYALNWYKSLLKSDYPVARVVAVPKDSRGPRLISEEPLELQYLQQGYLKRLAPFLEESSPLTKGFVNFTRQDINQNLALQGSKTGEWATIDLSDASDRVSDLLVYLLFPGEIYKDLRALRSHYTILPTGEKVRLNMFAPMGSAICFPVEALVFWALCKGAIRKHATECSDDRVFVYGDDIIVASNAYSVVCEELESFGLRVNRDKSYHTGLFRESCGVEAWSGYNITPSRLKQMPPSRRNDVKGLCNWVAVHNALRATGYQLAARRVQTVVESVVQVPWNIQGLQLSFQDSELTSSLVSTLNKGFKQRWNPRYHTREIKVLGIRQKPEISSLDGWKRLHRNLLMTPRDPDRWQRRNAVSFKRVWTRMPYSL